MERNSKSSWLPPWTRIEHAARYTFAAAFVSNKVVIDCACGSGIGSMLFARTAREVWAIDSAEDALREVMAPDRPTNLRTLLGDASSLEVPSNFADIYISLETIEHIQGDEDLLKEARRILKPEGLFICSTPNRELTNPGTSISDKPWNPFHVREYNLPEFRQKLERHFVIENIYGQNPVRKSWAHFKSRLSSVIGKGLVIKLNKALKCRWFLLPQHKVHSVRGLDPNYDYEFYIAVGRVPR